MYVIFESLLGRGIAPKGAVLITRKVRDEFKGLKQVVVDDRPLRVGSPLDYIEASSLKHYYKLAETYLKPIRLVDRYIVFIVDASLGYDLALSLYILSKLSYEAEQRKIRLLVLIPRALNASQQARLYAWLKIVGILDIFYNMVNEGGFSLYAVDDDLPHGLLGMIASILGNPNNTAGHISFQYQRAKRIFIPILEARVVSQLISVHGGLGSIIQEYKALLLMFNHLLDTAPPELWDLIRRSETMSRLRSIKYRLDKLREGINKVELVLGKIASEYGAESKYTITMFGIPDLIDAMIRFGGIGRLYQALDIDKIMDAVNSIEVENAVPLLSIDGINEDALEYQKNTYASPDLHNLIEVFGAKKIETEALTGQILVLFNSGLPICEECSKRGYYVDLAPLRSAYASRAILPAETMYPGRIIVNGEILDSSLIHECGLINYAGYITANRIGDKIPCSKLFKFIQRAIL